MLDNPLSPPTTSPWIQDCQPGFDSSYYIASRLGITRLSHTAGGDRRGEMLKVFHTNNLTVLMKSKLTPTHAGINALRLLENKYHRLGYTPKCLSLR